MIDIDALKENLQKEIDKENDLVFRAKLARTQSYHMGRFDALTEILESLKSC